AERAAARLAQLRALRRRPRLPADEVVEVQEVAALVGDLPLRRLGEAARELLGIELLTGATAVDEVLDRTLHEALRVAMPLCVASAHPTPRRRATAGRRAAPARATAAPAPRRRSAGPSPRRSPPSPAPGSGAARSLRARGRAAAAAPAAPAPPAPARRAPRTA